MNDILNNSRECRYKGVTLLVSKITTTDGRTNVEYLLANTDRRVVKDAGAFPAEFVVHGTLHSTEQSWKEFTDRVNQLRSILNSPLPGEFVHPIYETFFCKHGKYTLDHDTSKTGRCDYKITLKQCDRNGNPLTPTGQLFSAPQVKKLALEANRKLQADSAAGLTHDNLANKPNTRSMLNQISDTFSGKFAALGETIKKATDFTEKAFAIKDKAAFYVDNPALLFADLADSLLGIDGLTADVFVKISKIRDLFNYGDAGSSTDFNPSSPDRISESPNTRDEAERKNNSDVMRNFMRAGAMVEYMGYSATIEPETTEEVDAVIEEMAESYAVIRSTLQADSSNEDPVYFRKPDYSETITAMEELHTAADGFLRQLRETTPNIRTIKVNPMPVDVLSYLLYEDSGRAPEIMRLNGLTDPSVVSGEIKVLSR